MPKGTRKSKSARKEIVAWPFARTAILSMENLPSRPPKPYFGKNDPRYIRDVLKFELIDKSFLSIIRSGVRAWPFLKIALEYQDRPGAGFRLAKKHKAFQRREKHQERRRIYTQFESQPNDEIWRFRPYGPGSTATFRYHLSFIKSLQEDSERNPKSAKLLEFLARGPRFAGSHRYLVDHSEAWKKLFIGALGSQGRELRRYFMKEAEPDQVITLILKQRAASSAIFRAAYAYAFLRCLYGVQGGKEAAPSHSIWIPLLMRRANDPRIAELGISTTKLREYLHLSKTTPHLLKEHQKLSKVDRDVLAGLKFRQFYNLAIRPIPGGGVG